MLVLDGVYTTRCGRRLRFVPVPAPSLAELEAPVGRIGWRVGRQLERRGLLVRDAQNAYLDWDEAEPSALDDLAGHAISYRIAIGPNRGQKAFTLKTLPAVEIEVCEQCGGTVRIRVSQASHEKYGRQGFSSVAAGRFGQGRCGGCVSR